MKNRFFGLFGWCKRHIFALLLLPAFSLISLEAKSVTVTPDVPDSTVPYYSCLPDDNNVLTTISNVLSSLGTYSLVILNFEMKQTEGSQILIDPRDGKPRSRCKVYSTTTSGSELDSIHFCYDWTYFLRVAADSTATRDCTDSTIHRLGPDVTEGTWGAMNFRFRKTADKACIQAFLATSWVTLGCKYAIDESQSSSTYSCNISPSCYQQTSQKSQSFFPVTSVVVQCFTETLVKIFQDPDQYKANNCDPLTGSISLFTDFQLAMKRTVMAALTLFIIFTAIKIAMGMEAPRKGEIFMLIFKFALVLYFSVGGGATELFNFAMVAARSFAQMIYGAGGAMGLCQYPKADYAAGYSYLQLWDALDCRIAFYLGIDPMSLSISPKSTIRLFSIFMPGLLNFQLLFVILCVVFAIFVLSITVFLVHTYLIALIVIAILVFLAPIFVPCALFKPTKPFFDSWVRMLFGYTITPAILFSFMALMLTVFDMTFYGNCIFVPVTVQGSIASPLSSISNFGGSSNNKNVKYFVVKHGSAAPSDTSEDASEKISKCLENFNANPSQEFSNLVCGDANWGTDKDPACYKSMGYRMNPINESNYSYQNTSQVFKDNFMTEINGIFFNYTIWTDSSDLVDMLLKMLTIIFFCYLFYHLSKQLTNFAQDLTGTPGLGGLAVSPTAVIDKAIDAAFKVLDAKTGGKASKVREQVSDKGGQKGSGAAPRTGATEQKTPAAAPQTSSSGPSTPPTTNRT